MARWPTLHFRPSLLQYAMNGTTASTQVRVLEIQIFENLNLKFKYKLGPDLFRRNIQNDVRTSFARGPE